MKTVQNKRDVSLVWNRINVRPGQYGEVPEAIAEKWRQRGWVIFAETDAKPVAPTPKRPAKKPAVEDRV